MKTMYSAQGGAGPTYEIESDRHGSFTIRLDGTVVKRVTAVSSYVGKPRWGSRELEQRAVEDAKVMIDSHHR